MTKRYYQFCPVAKAAEVVSERWTPLLIRELLFGTKRFNELRRGLPLMSPTLLSNRLKSLEDAGVVYRCRSKSGSLEYRLTEAGEALRPVIDSLGTWGKQWIHKDVNHEDLDAGVLMWDIHRRLKIDRLPEYRLVIMFEFTDTPSEQRLFWLDVERGQVELSQKSPDRPEDLCIKTPLITLTRVWMGDQLLDSAIGNGEVEITGDPALTQEFGQWLILNEFAHLKRLPDTGEARLQRVSR